VNPVKKLLGQTAIYGLSTILGRLLNYFLVHLLLRLYDFLLLLLALHNLEVEVCFELGPLLFLLLFLHLL
jgi:hypothetical protein